MSRINCQSSNEYPPAFLQSSTKSVYPLLLVKHHKHRRSHTGASIRTPTILLNRILRLITLELDGRALSPLPIAELKDLGTLRAVSAHTSTRRSHSARGQHTSHWSPLAPISSMNSRTAMPQCTLRAANRGAWPSFHTASPSNDANTTACCRGNR